MKFQGSYSQLLQVTIFINVIIYLAATRPTVGNLTHLMMITGLVLIQPEGHLEPHNDLINAKSKLLKQCCIQKRFGDKDSSWGSGLLSTISARFYWFILFWKLLASSFQLYQMFFWTDHKEAHYLPEKFIRKQQFSFLFFFFWGHFWVPIFERYHFQSGCEPVKAIYDRLTKWTHALLK